MSEQIEVEPFKRHRAEILAGKQAEILKSLTNEELKKASVYQRVGMFGILYDKERLERGQSTQNVAYAEMEREMSEIDREIEVLEAELGKTVDNSSCIPVDEGEITISD
jgi:hypothetical protein